MAERLRPIGDADWRSLYITTYTSVFRTRVNVPGVPVW